jgi:hypothetical protein
MKQLKRFLTYATFASIWFFMACEKVVTEATGSIDPGNGNSNGNGNGNGNNNGNADSVYVLKVKAVIGIGDIIYDSIPASLDIISWDSNNVSHQKNIELSPGVNTISLPKSHSRYKLTLTQWGIKDEISFTKQEIQEGTVISMGGSRAAQKIAPGRGLYVGGGSISARKQNCLQLQY